MGFTLNLLETFRRYKLSYKNYLMVLIKMRFTRSDLIEIITKEGGRIKANRELITAYSCANYIMNTNIHFVSIENEMLFFTYKTKRVKLVVGKASDPCGVFFSEDYKFLDVKNKIVLDIGANIGDSSIYFALNEAKKVIAIEPYLYAYDLMKKNIELNNLNEAIEVINAGYGEMGKVIINSGENNNGKFLNEHTGEVEVPVYDLSYLLRNINSKGIILKMDCEGCEYNLLNEPDSVYEYFDKIQIEYHYGYEGLVTRLTKAGFEVKYTEPKQFSTTNPIGPIARLGFIFASRSSQAEN